MDKLTLSASESGFAQVKSRKPAEEAALSIVPKHCALINQYIIYIYRANESETRYTITICSINYKTI